MTSTPSPVETSAFPDAVGILAARVDHETSKLAVVPAAPATWCWSAGKRAVDLVVGVASLLIVVPLIAVLGAVSMIVYRANPLFRQQRRGIHEQQFTVMKIRSLPKSFPERHGKHHIHHHEFTGWSHLLRKSHLDELPQIFSIIGGSMSFVGPRPMIDEVIEELEPADRAIRAMVKPGLTGPWQISTMGSVALHDHPELDNQYVRRASLANDIKIMWLTLATSMGRPALEPDALLKRLGW